jgi:tetratricopeptide (TPR) repeat protein
MQKIPDKNQSFFVRYLPHFVIVIFNIIIFYPVLNLPFIAGDGNYLRQISPYFQEDLPKLSVLSSSVIFASKSLFGFNPILLRTIILLFHTLNCLLIIELTQKVFVEKKPLSLICAIIFALHPLNLAGTYFILSLGKIMSVTFMLTGIIYFEKTKSLFKTLIFFLLAFACDVTAIIMPICILDLAAKRIKRQRILTLSFLAALLLFKIIQINGDFALTYQYFKEIVSNLLRLISFTLIPFTNILYPGKTLTLKLILTLAALLILLIMNGYFTRIKDGKGIFLKSWIILWIAPFILQIKMTGKTAEIDKLVEFNTYAVTLPIILSVCIFLKNIFTRNRTKIIKYSYAVLFSCVTVFFIVSAKKAFKIAKSENSYYQTIASAYPARHFTNQYACFLIKERKNTLAYEVLTKNLKKKGSSRELSNSYLLLAKIYLNEQLPKQSIQFLETAIKTDPGNLKAKLELIKAYRQADYNEKSLSLAEKTLAVYPQNAAFYYQKGLTFLNMAQHNKAFENFKKACSLDKDYCNI